MRTVLKWAAVTVFLVVVGGFMAFLYSVPPFFTMPPEAFSDPEGEAPPSLDHIADPAVRAIAERGRYIVITSACIGCHQTPGPEGPRWDMYMAGGLKFVSREATVVSRNLTPDPETGIGRRTDDEIKRVLRSGVFHSGRTINHRNMPWTAYSHLSDEELHAVVVYLRQLKPVVHRIPDPRPEGLDRADIVEAAYGMKDYGSER
jgi:mono/diheme cytochrome c family protein